MRKLEARSAGLVEKGLYDPLTAAKAPSSELSRICTYYVIYESVLVNLVGFFTLFFQCELQAIEREFLASHPNVTKAAADGMFGHFWLKDDLNCSTPAAHCLTYMVAGWCMNAGVLQVFINFDGLRRWFFPSDWATPRGIKIICLYAFFVCDWYWVVIMYVSGHDRMAADR